MRGAVGIVAIGLVTAAVVGASTTSGNDVKTAVNSVEIPIDPVKNSRAVAHPPRCKGNRATVGGGFDLRPFDPSGAGPRVAATSGGSIGVEGANSGGATGTIKVEAYCWSGVNKTRGPRASATLPTAESGKVFQRCDRGFVALHGGFAFRVKGVPDYEQTAAIRSEAQATGLYLKHRGKKQGVTAEADNNSGTRKHRLSVHAECYRGNLKLVSGAAKATIPEGAIGAATATCPRRSFAISGGFKGNPGTYALASLKKGKRRWTAVAHRKRPGPGTLKTFVYCAR